MYYEDLLQDKKIRPYDSSTQEIFQLLDLATRDIKTARKLVDEDPDWAYSIAFNGVLQAGRALMLAYAYRPRGADHHGTVVRFVSEVLGHSHEPEMAMVEAMRLKRNRAVYELTGSVSQREAQECMAFSKDFVDLIRDRVTKQLRLPI